ncbi:MAG TPA: hypothetical protein VHB48_05210 [Chitinophagaceae bacterium]|jgi:hypothetical protein|nr:hypothetical protein [Chitinophagaceae bacterium]
MNNSNELAQLKTFDDLHRMQLMVRARVKEREKDLAERFKQLPAEALRAGIEAILPPFLSKRVTGMGIGVFRAITALIFNRKNKGQTVKDNILSSAKQLGLFSLAKAAYALLKRKTNRTTD